MGCHSRRKRTAHGSSIQTSVTSLLNSNLEAEVPGCGRTSFDQHSCFLLCDRAKESSGHSHQPTHSAGQQFKICWQLMKIRASRHRRSPLTPFRAWPWADRNRASSILKRSGAGLCRRFQRGSVPRFGTADPRCRARLPTYSWTADQRGNPEGLSKEAVLFHSVQEEGGGPFFQQNRLLFLPTDQVAKTTGTSAAERR